jgi:hypothetical protein
MRGGANPPGSRTPITAACSILAVLIASWNCCLAQPVSNTGKGLDPGQVAQLKACVQHTYDQMESSSETVCSGSNHPHYFDSGGNTESPTYIINYDLKNWPGYQYIAGSQSKTILNGACTFDMGATITSPTNFACAFYVAGCGLGKGGGNIRGYCTVKIHYVPQASDIARIKEYCLSTVLGVTATKPGLFPGSCYLP